MSQGKAEEKRRVVGKGKEKRICLGVRQRVDVGPDIQSNEEAEVQVR